MSNRTLILLGWYLFLASAVSFLIASIGDFWATLGSLFFLVACIAFLIPFYRRSGGE